MTLAVRRALAIAKTAGAAPASPFLPTASPKRARNLAKFMEGSHAVDEEGKPLRVYRALRDPWADHVDDLQFWTPDHPALGEYTFTTLDPDTRESMNVVPAHLAIKKPYVLRDDLAARRLAGWLGTRWEEHYPYYDLLNEPHARHELLKRGYDGVDMDDTSGFHDHRTFVTFHPHQIKSAIGNRGTFDPDEPEIHKAEGGFLRSHAAAAARALPQAKGTGQQMLASLKGVKPEEMKQARAAETFAQRPTVTRDELAEHFDQAVPHLQETVYGGPKRHGVLSTVQAQGPGGGDWAHPELPLAHFNTMQEAEDEIERRNQSHPDAQHSITEGFSGGRPRFSSYTIPGGENYREVLMHTPVSQPDHSAREKFLTDRMNEIEDRLNVAGGWMPHEDRGRLEEEHGRLSDEYHKLGQAEKFTSSHWPGVPNVVAHLRMSDRGVPIKERDNDPAPQWRKALHVEELQSDWAQKGRAEGFAGEEAPEIAKLNAILEDDNTPRHEWDAAMARLRDLEMVNGFRRQSAIPAGPYVTNTNHWTDLGLKRALHEAAHGGHDALIWTPGKHQAERYDLSKYVDVVRYHAPSQTLSAMRGGQPVMRENVPPEKLAEHIGKDAAAKIAEQMKPGFAVFNRHSGNQSEPFNSEDEAHKRLASYPETLQGNLEVRPVAGSDKPIELRGNDLQVGGHGMKGYYDNILPKRLLALAREHDPEAKLTSIPIEYQKRLDPEEGDDVMYADSDEDGFYTTVENEFPALRITPKMRESIKASGFKAYAAGGAVERPAHQPLKDWFGEDSNIVDEMGAPKRLYHGTTSPHFKNFRISRDDDNPVPGISLTGEPEVANFYATQGHMGRDAHEVIGANIVPVHARGRVKDYIEYMNELERRLGEDVTDNMSGDEIVKHAKADGLTGFYMPENDEYRMFHPRDIRHVLDRKTGGAVNHQPTEAQKAAGNYAKEHVRVHGLDITIENKKGSVREGVDADGKRWSCVLPADYGYIKRTEGADGDHVDVYLGPNHAAPTAFVINQRHHSSGRFDEHKVMLGFSSEREAADAYDRAFSDGMGRSRLGTLEPMSIDAFKHWLKNGDTTKPANAKHIVADRIAKAFGGKVRGGVEPSGAFEIAPGETYGKERQQQWETLHPNHKTQISNQMVEEFLPRWQHATGITGKVTTGLGGYNGATNPNYLFQADKPEDLHKALTGLGSLFRQDSMMGIGDKPFPGSERKGGVRVQLPPGTSHDEAHKVYSHLNRLGLAEGHSTDPKAGTMDIILDAPEKAAKQHAINVDAALGGKYPVYSFGAHVGFPSHGADYDVHGTHSGRAPETPGEEGQDHLAALHREAHARLDELLGEALAKGKRPPARAKAVKTPKQFEEERERLFDMSALHEVPKVKQFDLPRNNPPRGVPARVTDLVGNKKHRDALMKVIQRGREMGGERWYNAEPLRHEFVKRHGPEQGNKLFRHYMDFVAATSPRSEVGANARNASYYYHRLVSGQGMPEVGTPNPKPYGHLAQRLHQMNAERVAGAGWDPLNNPKPASFVENLVGNQQPVTVDTHAFRLPAIIARDPRFLETGYQQGKGLPQRNIMKEVESGALPFEEAAKTPAYWATQPKANEYAAMERHYQDIAREMGITPAQAQASAWVGGGHLTGLASDESKPFVHFLEDRIHTTAAHHNMDPRDVMDRFIRGEMPLRARGGAVGRALAIARGK